MSDYIVVPVADAQILRVALGMLYAQLGSYDYPMPGPTLYVWDPSPNADGTLVSFGPLDSLGTEGIDATFGAWVLGQSIVTSLGTLTVPAVAQTLDAAWFPPPPPPPPYAPCSVCGHTYGEHGAACSGEPTTPDDITLGHCSCPGFVLG